MPVFRNKIGVYEECISQGTIKPQEGVDIEKIESTLEIIKEDLESAKELLKTKKLNTSYKLFYDALRSLTETYLRFDKIKSLNHKCLFNYLCVKHEKLELSWEFFEKVRTKRNGINYYGTAITEKDWKGINTQINLYINTLTKEIMKKIKEYKQ